MQIMLLDPPQVRPPNRAEDVVNAPLAAALMSGYIAAALTHHGFDVALTDANRMRWTLERTESEMTSADFDILGVHLTYLWECTKDVMESIRQISCSHPHAQIVLYGYYPTFQHEQLLRNYDFVDFVIVGEPEMTFVELAENLRADKKSLSIPGVAGKSGDDIITPTQRVAIDNLNSLPFPQRISATNGTAVEYILGSRGCYGACTFCYLNPFYGKGREDSHAKHWRGRSPQNIIAEIDELIESCGTDSIYFADANFFGGGKAGQQRAMELAELLASRPVTFGLECRANDVHEPVIGKLVSAGLQNVFLGVESGADSVLKRFRKGLTAAENRRALDVLHNCGIEPNLGFIMFNPETTFDEVEESFKFLRDADVLRRAEVTAHVLHHRQCMLAGAPAFASLSSSDAPENYEAEYRIKDERVESFSRVVIAVCNAALSAISRDGRSAPPANDSAINTFLIDFFRSTLDEFKRSRAPLLPSAIDSIQAQAIHKIETLTR